MVRIVLFIGVLLVGTAPVLAQASQGSGSTQNSGAPPQSTAQKKQVPPDAAPPRSDDGDLGANSAQVGESSSSKDTKINIDPPENDDKAHPGSTSAVADMEAAANGGTSVGEFHPWDPHKAAKDVEVGDYYFKRGNYRGAESRYREALHYKDNDAIATLRLAESLEKLGEMDEAADRYQGYLKILPDGPLAEEARKGLERVRQPQKSSEANAK